MLLSSKKNNNQISTILLNMWRYPNDKPGIIPEQTKMPRNHPGCKAGHDPFHTFQKKVQIKILCLL